MKDFHIFSERIIIRAMKKADIDAIFSYRSLPEVARYQYWEPFTKDETISLVSQCLTTDLGKEDQWTGLVIVYNGKVIGDCAFNICNTIAEIGCNISPEYQGKGFAKEALSLLISYCIKSLNVKEITGITDSRNTASIRLMESLRMNKVSDFENHIICKGENCIEYKYLGKR